jgi:hypothetical protein
MGFVMAHPHPQPEQQGQLPYTVPVVFGPAKRAQFAYRIITEGRGQGAGVDEAQLNALGKDGWLLVSVRPSTRAGKSVLEYVFVRTEQ